MAKTCEPQTRAAITANPNARPDPIENSSMNSKARPYRVVARPARPRRYARDRARAGGLMSGYGPALGALRLTCDRALADDVHALVRGRCEWPVVARCAKDA